ncbi:MAG: acyl carrier protein [Christensenella sp.]|nr:acyl carrier protein [Christensenella sp.]
MLERVITIISDHECIEKENLNADTHLLQDLNINSFDLIDLICAFEEEFDIEIDEEQAKKFLTIGDIAKYLEELS